MLKRHGPSLALLASGRTFRTLVPGRGHWGCVSAADSERDPCLSFLLLHPSHYDMNGRHLPYVHTVIVCAAADPKQWGWATTNQTSKSVNPNKFVFPQVDLFQVFIVVVEIWQKQVCTTGKPDSLSSHLLANFHFTVTPQIPSIMVPPFTPTPAIISLLNTLWTPVVWRSAAEMAKLLF